MGQTIKIYCLQPPDLLQSTEMARPGIFTHKKRKYTKKIPSSTIFWNLKTKTKIPKKKSKMCILAFRGYFFGIFGVFWGYFLGVQAFGPGGISSVLFLEIPGRPLWGL